MSYRALRAHVDAAEAQLEQRLRRSEQAWSELKHSARRSATPTRILGAGFLSGLLLGVSEPLARLTQGTRFVDLATSLISLAGALQAQAAAETAGDAVDVAHAAASNAEAAGESAQSAMRDVA
jgi:hypothetical protein